MHIVTSSTACILKNPLVLHVTTHTMENTICVKTEENSYPLRKITEEELLFYRSKKDDAYFVLKVQDSLFCTQIPSTSA